MNVMLKYFGYITKATDIGEDPDAWKNIDNKKRPQKDRELSIITNSQI